MRCHSNSHQIVTQVGGDWRRRSAALTLWIRTTGACDVEGTSAAGKRSLRSCSRRLCVPVAVHPAVRVEANAVSTDPG
jgi:hypothetical protein